MLDTCAFIDAVTEPDNLGADVCALMEDYENEFCISIETIREVILKYKNKKVYRFLMEPRKMFSRYFVDDVRFFWYLLMQMAGRYKNPFG